MFLRCSGAGAIRWEQKVKSSHVGIMGGGRKAARRGKPSEDESLHLKMPKQHFERCHIERRVKWLQYEVIFAVRHEGTYELRPRGFQAAANEHLFFASPIPEIVIDVEHRNAKLAGTCLQVD